MTSAGKAETPRSAMLRSRRLSGDTPPQAKLPLATTSDIPPFYFKHGRPANLAPSLSAQVNPNGEASSPLSPATGGQMMSASSSSVFGASGAGLSAYKGANRTGGCAHFRLRHLPPPGWATHGGDHAEADDDEAVFLGLAGLLLDDPHNAWLLQDVIQAMAADLGPDASVVAREVLATLNPRQLTP